MNFKNCISTTGSSKYDSIATCIYKNKFMHTNVQDYSKYYLLEKSLSLTDMMKIP